MPELTRRRSTDAPEKCWHIYYGDVHAHTTRIRGSGPAASIQARIQANIRVAPPPPFDEARADFEAAWQIFLSKRTEADFQAWRDARD